MTIKTFFFPTVYELLYSPWGFGGYKQGYMLGKMSPQIGIAHIILFLISTVILFFTLVKTKKNISSKISYFFIISTLISFFLASSFSKILWDISPLKVVQIPWRFVGYSVFCIAVLGGFIISKIPTHLFRISFVVLFSIFLLYANRNHIRVNQYTHAPVLQINEPYPYSTTSKFEHAPKYAALITKTPNQNGEILSPGSGRSRRIIWKSNYQKYEVEMKTHGLFRAYTYYFPGWEMTANRKPMKINYQNPSHYMSVALPAGNHIIEFYFREVWYRKLANFISITSFIGLLFIFFITQGLLKNYRNDLESPKNLC